MKSISRTATLAAVLFATAEAFAPVPLAGRATISEPVSTHGISSWQLDASKTNDSNQSISSAKTIKSILQRKSKPVTFAIATASAFLSCLPGQSLFKPLPAQASAPIVLREALPKDDPPMVQAMTQAKELKKKKSLEEFDTLMQKLNDIEDKEGKKARDAYEKQYNADKEANAAQKVVDLEKLKRDLLDGGKDPFTFLDAEREVFLFEHDVDLAKVPGTPHNEQMIKNFRSKGKNKPTYENQQYIVKCQVADLKARGVDPLEHFSQEGVMDKTRSIYYKMKDADAAIVAEQYKELMEQYGGRLTPAQDGEVPFVRSSSAQSVPGSSGSAKEMRAAEKAAAKEKRAQEKAAAKAKRAAEKQARADAKVKAKADKAAAKGNRASTVEEPVVVVESTEVVVEKQVVPAEETTSVSKATKKKGSKFDVASLTKKVPPKQAAVVVVGGGGAALGYRLYTDASVAKRNEQYKSIMMYDDDDFEDDDDYDDDY